MGKRKGEEEKKEQQLLVYLGPMTSVCQHCQALNFPSESLKCCHNGKVSLPPLCDYPSPLMDFFTGSNTAESSNFQDNIRSTTVPSPLLHLSFEIISYIIHQVPLCGRYLLVWYKYSIF